MLLPSRLGFLRGASRRTPPGRHPARRGPASRRGLRPTLERLEDLTLLTNYTAATVSDLIADINASNQQGGSNTIALVAGNPFTLTAVDNTTDGATGLPVIAAHDSLTIVGNGDTIARSTVTGTPAFRLLDVAAGASLTLQNLTLQGGLASGAGVSAEGGAVYSQGTLDLNGVTVQNNDAPGQRRSPFAGPAKPPRAVASIPAARSRWKAAARFRTTRPWAARAAHRARGGGGDRSGGGLYVAGGTVTVTGASLSANTAQGGQGGWSAQRSTGPARRRAGTGRGAGCTWPAARSR